MNSHLRSRSALRRVTALSTAALLALVASSRVQAQCMSGGGGAAATTTTTAAATPAFATFGANPLLQAQMQQLALQQAAMQQAQVQQAILQRQAIARQQEFARLAAQERQSTLAAMQAQSAAAARTSTTSVSAKPAAIVARSPSHTPMTEEQRAAAKRYWTAIALAKSNPAAE